MAGELVFVSGVTGQTVHARLKQGGTTVGSDISCPEDGATPGTYIGNMAGNPGYYQVVFLISGNSVGGGSIDWDGRREITGCDKTIWPMGGLQRG